jgi:hypothetical protein
MAADNKRQTAIFAVSLDAKPSTCAENYQQFRCTLCLEFGAVTLKTEARISDILRRNCLLKPVIEEKIKGQIEVTRRRGRRRKKLLDGLGDRRGYCHLKEEALDRIKWRNRFGPVV